MFFTDWADVARELTCSLEALEEGCETCDAVAARCRLDGGDAAVALARLEILGYVRSDQLGRLERSALASPG